MIIFPSLYIQTTLNGISAWAFNVLPSILPFMIFIKILTSLGALDKLSKAFTKPCKLLFKTPPVSALVFFTSIISGYPVGAKMTADLYENGKITKSDAYKMCSFCSTSGPMFIIGAVGASMLENKIYGYIIIIAHLLGALINGILWRKLKVKDEQVLQRESAYKQKEDFSSIVIDSTLSLLSVGAIIAIFFVIITSLSPIFNLFPQKLACVFEGLVEITRGCMDIAAVFKSKWAVVISTFVISFGGLSTILQSQAMLAKLKMPTWLFIMQKITHAISATLVAFIIVLFL